MTTDAVGTLKRRHAETSRRKFLLIEWRTIIKATNHTSERAHRADLKQYRRINPRASGIASRHE
jgi:hypothetical protein